MATTYRQELKFVSRNFFVRCEPCLGAVDQHTPP